MVACDAIYAYSVDYRPSGAFRSCPKTMTHRVYMYPRTGVWETLYLCDEHYVMTMLRHTHGVPIEIVSEVVVYDETTELGLP